MLYSLWAHDHVTWAYIFLKKNSHCSKPPHIWYKKKRKTRKEDGTKGLRERAERNTSVSWKYDRAGVYMQLIKRVQRERMNYFGQCTNAELCVCIRKRGGSEDSITAESSINDKVRARCSKRVDEKGWTKVYMRVYKSIYARAEKSKREAIRRVHIWGRGIERGGTRKNAGGGGGTIHRRGTLT